MLTAYPATELTWPALILLQETNETRSAPVGQLGEALARTLVEAFGDAVLIMRVSAGAGDSRIDTSERPHRLTIDARGDANESIRRALNQHALHYAYTFLDVSALANAAAFTDELVAFLNDAELPASLHCKLVRLRAKATPAHACFALVERYPRWKVITTAVLAPSAPDPDRPVAPREGSLLELFRGAPDQPARPAQIGESPPTRWYEGCQNPEEVRVRMGERGELLPACLARWARAISDRRFGLALGGSGAWGFAHAALISALEEAGIPIDLVASASSGSVVGAYYCALGRAGIHRLLAHRWQLQAAAMSCFVSMTLLERFIGRDTAFVPLRELEVIFLPVTTNLSTMRMECVTDASLAWGVRASSTAPGLFGSTLNGDTIYVDGAVACNVPVDLVKWRGADVVVAMNALPRPTGLKAGQIPFNLGLRARQLSKSLGLVFQDLGDWEARGHMTFDAPRVADPLLGTSQFYKGKEIYESVLAHPNFIACVREVKEVWNNHTRARLGLGEASRQLLTSVNTQPVALGDGLQALPTSAPAAPTAPTSARSRNVPAP